MGLARTALEATANAILGVLDTEEGDVKDAIRRRIAVQLRSEGLRDCSRLADLLDPENALRHDPEPLPSSGKRRNTGTKHQS